VKHSSSRAILELHKRDTHREIMLCFFTDSQQRAIHARKSRAAARCARHACASAPGAWATLPSTLSFTCGSRHWRCALCRCVRRATPELRHNIRAAERRAASSSEQLAQVPSCLAPNRQRAAHVLARASQQQQAQRSAQRAPVGCDVIIMSCGIAPHRAASTTHTSTQPQASGCFSLQ
jgi:hypothetical protein